MKLRTFTACLPVLLIVVFLLAAKQRLTDPPSALAGAWRLQHGNAENMLVLTDSYYMVTEFDKASRQLISTSGGRYTVNGNLIHAVVEFDSRNKEMVGRGVDYNLQHVGNQLLLVIGENTVRFEKVDDGTGPLAGVWRSGGKLQDGKVAFAPLAARKTFKLITGKRFQWTAMNTDTKEIIATGGGSYSFVNGKYTENIDFFSRDSSRVGLSLVFDDKVEGDNWYHNGLSTKGEPVHEIWGRVK